MVVAMSLLGVFLGVGIVSVANNVVSLAVNESTGKTLGRFLTVSVWFGTGVWANELMPTRNKAIIKAQLLKPAQI